MAIKQLFLHVIVLTLLISCGKNLNDDPNIAKCNPVLQVFKEKIGFAIDKRGNLWQWHYNDDWEPEYITKLKIKNVHSVAYDQGLFAYAVAGKGKSYVWMPALPEHVAEYAENIDIIKIQANSDLVYLLLKDGRIQVVKSDAYKKATKRLDTIEYSKFEDVVDFESFYSNMLAIDKNGLVWAVGENKRVNPDALVPNNTQERLTTPTRIEGFSKIKKLSLNDGIRYAVAENGDIFYWGDYVKRPYQKLNKKGTYVDGTFVFTEAEKLVLVDSDRKAHNSLSSLGDEAAFKGIENICASWNLYYYSDKKLILDKEGKLYIATFDYQPKTNSFQLSKPIRIGDFEVDTKYFTSL